MILILQTTKEHFTQRWSGAAGHDEDVRVSVGYFDKNNYTEPTLNLDGEMWNREIILTDFNEVWPENCVINDL